MSRLAVLGYHKIGPPSPGAWETWYYVDAQTFSAQLSAVRECGWQWVDAGALRDAVRGDGELPERAALVTFDDGYVSMRDHALPVLQAHGCPSILFVPTAFVGATNTFDQDEEPVEAICDWDALAELDRAGMRVQSHGVSHTTFSALTDEQRRDELTRSRAVLEARLEGTVDLFAFPYGDDAAGGPDVRSALRECGYVAAFGYGGEPQLLGETDRFGLERVAMGPDTDVRALLEAAG